MVPTNSWIEEKGIRTCIICKHYFTCFYIHFNSRFTVFSNDVEGGFHNFYFSLSGINNKWF